MIETKMFQLMAPKFYTAILVTRIAAADEKAMLVAGWREDEVVVLVTILEPGMADQTPADPNVAVARELVLANWEKYQSGQVIDVEFETGKVSKPKEPREPGKDTKGSETVPAEPVDLPTGGTVKG